VHNGDAAAARLNDGRAQQESNPRVRADERKTPVQYLRVGIMHNVYVIDTIICVVMHGFRSAKFARIAASNFHIFISGC